MSMFLHNHSTPTNLFSMFILLQDIYKKQNAALAEMDKHTESLRHLRVRGEDVISLDMTHRVAVQRVRDLETDLAVANSRRASMHLVEAEQEVVTLKKRFQKVQCQACYCCTAGELSHCCLIAYGHINSLLASIFTACC